MWRFFASICYIFLPPSQNPRGGGLLNAAPCLTVGRGLAALSERWQFFKFVFHREKKKLKLFFYIISVGIGFLPQEERLFQYNTMFCSATGSLLKMPDSNLRQYATNEPAHVEKYTSMQCCGAGPILTGSGSCYRLRLTQFLKHKFK